MNKNYIQEIQSLRGISMMMTFLFHLNQEFFSHAYLGAEVFFVISGFVITKIIYERSVDGTFTFKNFLISRFLRLIPAIFVMVMIVSFLLLISYQFQARPDTQINTGLLSLVGLSNFYLIFLDNDYFNSFDQNIFEHTWSLSVEFQFYIIYPFLLLFLHRFFKDKIKPYVFAFFLILIIFLFYNFIIEHEFFYQSESRIWEFIVGTLTYFLYKKKLFNFNFILIFSFFSLILFFYTEVFLYLIIFMCFFTSFIILSFDKLYYLRLLLNNKALCYLGNISYSIYLWHLPVIFFTNTFFVGLDYYFFSTVMTLILAMVSFYFIEIPFRNSSKIRNFTLKKIFTLKKLGIVTSIFAVFFIYVDLTNSRNEMLKNHRELYGNIANKISFYNFPEMKHYPDKTCHENYGQMIFKSDCFKTNNSNKLIYFYGDSSMQDLFQGFKDSDIKADKLFTSYNNSSFWKPILKGYSTGDATYDLVKNYDLVTKNYEEVFLIISFNHEITHDRVNNSRSYYHNQEKAYSRFIKDLPENIKLIFIKDTPQFRYSARNCFIINKVSFGLFNNNDNKNKCDHNKSDVLKKLNSAAQMFDNLRVKHNLAVISLDDYFCDDKKCSFYKKFESTKFPKKYDGYHLTKEASKNISNILNERIKQAIYQISN